MARVAFGILGPTAVWRDGKPVLLSGELRRRLLSRLLISANKPIPAARLAEDLWVGESPSTARSTLKSHVTFLRRLVGSDRLIHRDGGYVLGVDPGELDSELFENELDAAKQALGKGKPTVAANLIGVALARWRGLALDDVADQPWAVAPAARLEELRAEAVEVSLRAAMQIGDYAAVVSRAEEAVAEHPLKEALWVLLITALYRCARQADALRAYQRVRELLADEIGISPGAELTALEQAILRQDPALDGSRGEPAPPVVTTACGLPGELTSFIGREAELDELARLLGHNRLVTLIGPGGTGKTRLGIRLARSWATGERQVVLVELAALTDSSQVLRHLVAALGAREQEGVALGDIVRLAFVARRTLVLLDNCEHVLEGAAEVAEDVLRDNGEVRVLATSRQPLSVPGEVVYRVPPMSLPSLDVDDDPDALLGCESVRLFVERAKSHQPGFRLELATSGLVRSLCGALDGLPLAIELAAARVRTMSLADLERRLDNRLRLLVNGGGRGPARHRTLWDMVDWSFRLLDDIERDMFCRLAVFAGGWNLDTAEDFLVRLGADRRDVAGPLLALVDKSLVVAEPIGAGVRYRLHETVRHYAAERLAALGDDTVAAAIRAHASVFLALAERAVPHLSGPGQVAWRSRLERDHDNLGEGLRHFLTCPETAEEAMRFGAALSWYWSATGQYAEGADLLESALNRPDAAPPSPARAAALNATGHVLFRQGHLVAAERRLSEARRLARELDSPELAAEALRHSAWVADRRGDQRNATALAAEAVELATRTGNLLLMARAHDVRAATLQVIDPEQAQRDYSLALELCGRCGDHQGRASVLNNLAVLALEQQDQVRALRLFEEALAIARDIRDEALVAYLEYGVGLAAQIEGLSEQALPSFRRALEAAWHTGQQSLIAYALAGISLSWVETGQERVAATLHGGATALFSALGESLEPLETTLSERRHTELCDLLGADADQAFAEGARMALAALISIALDRTSSVVDA